jgi:hypothetical protein
MNTSTQTLPNGYTQTGEVNLKKDKRLTILLNLVALIVTALLFYLLPIFGTMIRSDTTSISGIISISTIMLVIGLTVSVLIVHELIHGFFFWLFSGSRPVFALRPLYAYAGAPGWYFSKRQFAIIALGPLVIVGALGLLLMLLGPVSWLVMIAFLLALNTGGAVGDLFVFVRLLKCSPTSFTNDTGEVVTFFERPVLV